MHMGSGISGNGNRILEWEEIGNIVQLRDTYPVVGVPNNLLVSSEYVNNTDTM